MKPSQTIYILRKLRATLATDGDEQAALALEIAVQAIEREQETELLQQSGRKQSTPVERIRGPMVMGAPRLGGIADHLAARRAVSGSTNV